MSVRRELKGSIGGLKDEGRGDKFGVKDNKMAIRSSF